MMKYCYRECQKIDEYRNVLVLENKIEIPINEIIDISGDIVNSEFFEKG